jgi:hypothetical protein
LSPGLRAERLVKETLRAEPNPTVDVAQGDLLHRTSAAAKRLIRRVPFGAAKFLILA